MLRITPHDSGPILTLQLEGRLAGPWLEELETCWKNALSRRRGSRLRIDLTGVTSVDAEGKACLLAMHQQGAEFIAADCLMKAIVDEITEASTSQVLAAGDEEVPCTQESRKQKGMTT